MSHYCLKEIKIERMADTTTSILVRLKLYVNTNILLGNGYSNLVNIIKPLLCITLETIWGMISHTIAPYLGETIYSFSNSGFMCYGNSSHHGRRGSLYANIGRCIPTGHQYTYLGSFQYHFILFEITYKYIVLSTK